MDNSSKWLISIICGTVATFFQQYGLFIVFVSLAIVFDCITGLIKAKTIGEGLTSQKGWKGFWKKIALLVGLFFSIYLDYAVPLLFVKTGLTLDIDLPFALIICCYIVLNECISIAENLYLINPESFPRWIARMLKVAKGKIEKEGSDYDETGNDDNTTE